MDNKMLRVTFLLFVSLFGVNAFQSFQTLIPNGNKVPNPCNTAELWPGVGHRMVGGSGVRNPFGLDFYNNNKTWTKALCEMDSDGDGQTNGAELGDPECTWTTNGNPPKNTTHLSHPGVCEPIGSPLCSEKNSWLTCPKKFSCPDFEKNTTQSMDLFLPNTSVPAQETTYMCYGFKMPNSTKYHEIGLIPHLDNKEIMHHMLIYGCSNPPKDEYMTRATECTMGLEGCQTIIGLWGVGMDGECHPDQYGFPIGQSGFEYIVVQLHWNNPQLTTGMFDASGVTIYYTDHLRPNDAMVVMTGQQYLEIPPKQESVKFEGTCLSTCSRYIQPPTINIASVFLHMHLLGKAGSIELRRDGALASVLAPHKSYDYNTPETITFEKPIEFKAGDEIKVYCEFQSLKNNNTVYWGEGTQDEMCYGFITIYPAVTYFDFCGEYENLPMCSMPQFDFFKENNCLKDDFDSLMPPILQHCTLGNCSAVCKVLMKGLHSTGCAEGSMWNLIRRGIVDQYPGTVGAERVAVLDNCLQAVLDEESSATVSPTTGDRSCEVNKGNSIISNAALHNIMFIMFFLSIWFLQ